MNSGHLSLVPEGRRILAGGGTTGNVENELSSPGGATDATLVCRPSGARRYVGDSVPVVPPSEELKMNCPAPEGRQTRLWSATPPGLGDYVDGSVPVVLPPANIRRPSGTMAELNSQTPSGGKDWSIQSSPSEGGTTNLFRLRRDISHCGKLRQRSELLDWQSPDDQFR